MDQILEIVTKYGGSGAVGAIILYIIMRVGKAGGVPAVTIHWGKAPAEQPHVSAPANGGNGNGKLTKAEVAELIALHHTSCSTELYKHIDEFNRTLGRIEGRLESITKNA